MSYCVKSIKAAIFFAILIALNTSAFSQSIYESSGWKVLKSNDQSLILSFNPKFSGFDTIITKSGIQTLYPGIKGAVELGEPGNPLTLLSSVNITVPSENGFELKSVELKSIKTFEGIITPIPAYYKDENSLGISFKINENAYEQTSLLNKQIKKVNIKNDFVKLKYSGIARNRHLATLDVITADFENGKIFMPEELIIEIAFNSKGTTKNSFALDDWDLPVSINHFESKQWLIPRTSSIDKLKMTGKEEKKEKLQNTIDKPWIKIRIVKEGLYKITPSMLADLGYTIPKEEVGTIKIYGNGGLELSEKVSDAVNNNLNEQNIIVKTNSSGEFENVIFYGSPANGFKYVYKKGFNHYINHYSDNNYYILTWKGSAGKRAEARKSPEGTVINRPTTFTNLLFYEQELWNAYLAGSGRTWFGGNFFPVTFTEQLFNLDRNGNIYFRIAFAHRGTETGKMKLKINNNELLNEPMSPISGYTDAYRIIRYDSLPASYISQDNRVSMQFDYTGITGASSANGYFDWFEIHYPAYLLPTDNQIGFFTDPSSTGLTEFSINNFTNQELYGFEVTDPANPELIENISNIGNMFVFRTENVINYPERYFISANTKSPSLERAEFGDLRNDIADADMIVITHPKLTESAEAYKNYRENQSKFKVMVVRTDHIYSEFGSGISDPTAIRDFISFAFHNWNKAPRFVLLWGDGHYDFKQIQTKETNFVPTYQTEDESYSYNEIESWTSDDYFANISGNDDLIDIAIGRLPVYSEAIGERLIAKINTYENKSSNDTWRTRMTIVADDSWTFKGYDQTLHTGQAESLWRDVVPDDFQVKKIYLPDYPAENVTGGKRKPRVNEEILSTVNVSGTLLLSYIGHGNPRVWAHEEVFERSITVPQMKNIDKLFFMTAASCDFGRFDTPEIRSGAEELILSQVGGAIGSFSSTRLVFAEPNAQLNEQLFENIYSKNPETGEHLTMGEASFFAKYIKHLPNDKKYALLGDPAVKLLLPDYYTIIETINETDVTRGDTAIIQALSLVEIKGRISNPSSTATDESFNGTVIITMLDSDKFIQALEDDGSINGTIHRYYVNGGALNRSSYKVENGRFTAQFYIPKDISFSGLPGRLFAYAFTDDNKFANGNTRSFIISGITDVKNPDKTGPEINIYLDSREFIAGEIVNCKPLLIVDLSDKSGINTTGLGLGHRIEAWIDDSPNSLDLTEKFKSSVEEPGAGTVEEFLFNLNPGRHKIKVRAWDVFNNYSTAETFFRTTDCGTITISELFTYPNPTDGRAVIRFTHNISPPFSSELVIMNILGQKIYSNKQTITTSHIGEMEWTGYDSNGIMVPVGSYLFIINLETLDGLRKSENNILTIVR